MEEKELDYESIIMNLIVNCGEARSKAMEAMTSAREGSFKEAEEQLEEADVKLNLAHKVQTNLIVQEAGGTPVKVTLLMVHAQDHLMNAITVRELANEIIEIQKQLRAKQ